MSHSVASQALPPSCGDAVSSQLLQTISPVAMFQACAGSDFLPTSQHVSSSDPRNPLTSQCLSPSFGLPYAAPSYYGSAAAAPPTSESSMLAQAMTLQWMQMMHTIPSSGPSSQAPIPVPTINPNSMAAAPLHQQQQQQLVPCVWPYGQLQPLTPLYTPVLTPTPGPIFDFQLPVSTYGQTAMPAFGSGGGNMNMFMPQVLPYTLSTSTSSSACASGSGSGSVARRSTKVAKDLDRESRPSAGSYSGPVCQSCQATTTSVWRHVNNVTLCNLCGIRFKRSRTYCTHCNYIPTRFELKKSQCPQCRQRGDFHIVRTTLEFTAKQ